MTKRPLYAAAQTAASLAVLLTVFAAPVQAGANRQSGVCAACLSIAVDPGTTASLPGELQGMEVFVRVAAGSEEAGLAGLIDIEAKGGRPSLLVSGMPSSLPESMSGHVRRIVVTGPSRPVDQVDDVFAFGLKTSLTALRAAVSPTTLIGLSAETAQWRSLLSRDLPSYVDFVVLSDASPLGTTGFDVWRLTSGATTVREALAQTATADVTHVIWSLPEDSAVAGSLATELARVIAAPSPAVDPQQAPAGDRFAQEVQVVGSRSLTVEEVIARHQAAIARQSAFVQSIIATGTLALSFEAPGFPAPVTVSSGVTLYTSDGVTEIEQRDMRINGIELQGSAVPRLPIIEPERVASPPLAIALTDVYRYRLDRRETIGSTLCYVVSFQPDQTRADKSVTLFRGTAWIAADSFAMLKVSAAQTALRGPIVASEQVDDFREARPGVWLLARSDVRQMYEGAAHRTPIHRVLAIDRQEINSSDFSARRQRAYQSAAVMLRDTPEGYRYLKKGSAEEPGSPAVSGRAERVRTIAVGVIVDPNISIPLPFAGFSYVDFNFLGSGSQVNAFFGGTYGQLAFSVPSLARTRWQLGGQAFGIASSYNDRSFEHGREQYEQNLRQRPAHMAVWLLRPLSARVSFHAGYELDYTHLAGSDATDARFVVPADDVVHGAKLSLDAQRAGWNASVWWNPARRSGWRSWGRTESGDYDPSQADFQRYGISIARARVINPRAVAHIEAAWMSGNDLDRFSRYSFGTFDNRLRGYPSALIRYDRGAVLRTAVAYGMSRLVRVDGFFDSAAVHDPGFGSGLRNYTGVGGALEMPAFFGTLLAVEWGYGFRGINSNGTLGTQVVRVSGYKVF
ncbi:MAG: hypothetical protein ACJ731_12620 [Vicinamibacterales bacterium]